MTALIDCPKQMTHGPCGGVSPDGTCEVGELRCPFVPEPRLDPIVHAEPVALPFLADPLIVADVPALASDVDAMRAAAGGMAGLIDAGLTGDHGRGRVQLPPVLRAQVLAGEGLRPWIGLNCRDRNRVALEGELAGLRAVDVLAVHCVTGDHTRTGHRPDAQPVFDLDSVELAALTASMGLVASVAETPLSPPVDRRPARLAMKARAGASVCFVNHTGSAAVVADFVAEAKDLGASSMRFLACVPVVVSRASVAELLSFAGMVTPPGLLDEVSAAVDPFEAGVGGAVAFAESVLATGAVDGIDLSGVAGPGEEAVMARAMSEIARRLR